MDLVDTYRNAPTVLTKSWNVTLVYGFWLDGSQQIAGPGCCKKLVSVSNHPSFLDLRVPGNLCLWGQTQRDCRGIFGSFHVPPAKSEPNALMASGGERADGKERQP